MWWALGLLGGLWLWGGGELRAFEAKAARDIRAQLHGESAEVRVRTDLGDPFRAAQGHLRRVSIQASDFQTDGLPLFTEPERPKSGRVGTLELRLENFVLGGLRVERLRASIPGCRYDFGLAKRQRQIRLSRSGTGTGEVELLAKDLEPFILRKFREIKRVAVRFEGQHVEVEGYGEFLVLQTNFRVRARLIPQEGVALALTDAVIDFDGKPADPLSAKVLLDTLNPVVHLDRDLKLLDAVYVERLELQGDRLRAFGRTKIPTRPSPVSSLHAWAPPLPSRPPTSPSPTSAFWSRL